MKEIYKWIPLSYAGLVFIGFLNYSFYYSFFRINIASFLTTSELLLSFLQLTIPGLAFCGVMSMFIIMGVANVVLTNDNKSSNEVSDEDSEMEREALLIDEFIIDFIVSCRSRNYKSIWSVLFVLSDFLTLLFQVIGFVFALGFPFFIANQMMSKEPFFLDSFITILFGVAWFFMVGRTLSKLSERRGSDYKLITYFFLVLFMVCLLYINNKEKAYSVLRGDSNTSITFSYHGDTVMTDSSLIFIGRSEKYLFIRNVSTDENLIYETEGVTNFSMKFAVVLPKR